MIPKEIPFFARYRAAKLLGRPISPGTQFWKRFFRTRRKLPGVVTGMADNEMLYQFSHGGKEFSAYIRMAGSSDILVLGQVFAGKEYAPLAGLIRETGRQNKIRFIVDAGANVGYTALFLAQEFPEAMLVAIEPDEQNGIQLKKNFSVNQFSRFDLVESGLWSEECWLSLRKDRDEGKEWSFYVVPSDEPGGLRSTSLPAILNRYGRQSIDILKLDIEGSEQELFRHEEVMKEVLKNVSFLAMEIHDDRADRNQIYRVLRDCNFSWFEHGELTIARNCTIVPAG